MLQNVSALYKYLDPEGCTPCFSEQDSTKSAAEKGLGSRV